MIVGYGDKGILLLGIVDEDIKTLKSQHTLEFTPPAGTNFLTNAIIVVHAQTKAQLVEQLRAGGVSITDDMLASFMAGRRTDVPKKPF
jgi:predicted alpha/beta-hydrolase family hydrolase